MAEATAPDRVPSARTAKGRATRERIMAAAARLFAEQGYDSTSIEAVAAAADITVPGLYKHLPTKEMLMVEVARWATVTSAARAALGLSDELPQELAAIFAEYAADGQMIRRRLSIEISRASTGNATVHHALTSYNAHLRASLEQTITRARPALADQPTEVAMLAHLVMVLLMGTVHLDSLDPSLVGEPALIDFLRGRLVKLFDEPIPSTPRATLSVGSMVTAPADPLVPTDGRRRRAAESRQRIIEAGCELFALNGYDGTTVDMLAQRASITVPGLYRHVASKEELLVEVARWSFKRYRINAPFPPGQGPSTLAALVSAFCSSGDKVARRLVIELSFGAWRNQALTTGLHDFHLQARQNLAASLAGPDRDPADYDLPALAALLVFMGVAHIDTVDPVLVDNKQWSAFLRRRMPQLLG